MDVYFIFLDLYSCTDVLQKSHTGGEKDEGCSCVNNASSGHKDWGRSAVTYGLVDAPVPARRKSLSEGAIQPHWHVSTDIANPTGCRYLHERDISSEF